MQFEMRREGPGDVCGDKCRTWVSAVGAITSDTLADFEAFAKNRDLRGATIVFESVGGSVIGALALGRAIRRLDMITSVGRTIPLSGRGKDARATLSPNASCESMCAFVLLAGARRYVPPEARVLVHQIWLGDRRDDAIAANYSAEDLMIVQRDIGRLAQFTIEMGGTGDLLETALRIPPWEPMRALSYDEIRRMRLSTASTAFDRAPPAVPQVSASAAVQPTTVAVRASNISERSWSVVDHAGIATLARRHPMTAEGEEIGTFDIMFGCGDTADSYAVSYVDRRRSRDARQQPQGLKDVVLSVGQKAVPLKVVRSSDGLPGRQEIETATGEVPASFVKVLAEAGSRTLTVSATDANNVETVIRVGNTGFVQALPQLTTACAKQTRSRNVRADLAERAQ